MNERERHEYRPECSRCGHVVTDIDWADISSGRYPDEMVPGRMRCSTPDCYDHQGSRVTTPLVPGGLTMADHAWVRRMMAAAS